MAATIHAGRRVLIIDDDIATQELMSTILACEGYRVAVARNGQDGIERLGAYERPDVIVLDLKMPGMDGRGFCEARQQDKDLAGIPVVILSGADDVAEQATALGAATYLRKPVDPVKFLHRLRECGVRQELTDEAAHQNPGASKPEVDSTWSS